MTILPNNWTCWNYDQESSKPILVNLGQRSNELKKIVNIIEKSPKKNLDN